MAIPKNGFNYILPFLFGLWHFMNISQVVFGQNRITSLPGYEGPLPSVLETGYIGVEKEELQLFYYFVESENNPKEDPILLWLPGGPHCSGMSALLYEIGPFQLEEKEYNGTLPRLLPRQYSWSKIVNILFVDLPVGSGYSYATTTRANYSGDLKIAENVNEFLRKWMLKHTQYVSNPLYVGGDSYSGFTLPPSVHRMVNDNEEGMQPILNLKGYLLGNPATDRSIDGNTQVAFAHGMGLISDEFFESIKTSCNGVYHNIDPNNHKCKSNVLQFTRDLREITTSHILENYCNNTDIQKLITTKRKRIMSESTLKYNYGQEHGVFACRKESYKLSLYWMNDNRVQEALHAYKGTPIKWIRCHDGKYHYRYEVESSVKYHVKLSAKGFRSLIYRYTRTYSNKMTFATVKGAGHTAPEYKPKECAAMFKRWIAGDAL
ncbi:serine carboxypeptidase-like 19 isoform X2 [Silene latifolia]|uniref:serine carboxypeptidase-like 19 isoform X2 n=1 Tax=Silene latifolia TaxID=37657 RepID=UPI003D772A2C